MEFLEPRLLFSLFGLEPLPPLTVCGIVRSGNAFLGGQGTDSTCLASPDISPVPYCAPSPKDVIAPLLANSGRVDIDGSRDARLDAVALADHGVDDDPIGMAATRGNDVAAIQPSPELVEIGDFVWEDTNGNGIQDPGEPGIADVAVYLLDAQGDHILGGEDELVTAKSDRTGSFRFRNLTPGTYRLLFVLPTGYGFTPHHVGKDETIDSDVDSAKGMTPAYTLIAGQTIMTVDAGARATASSLDSTRTDRNARGTEPGTGDLAERAAYWAGFQPSDFLNGLAGNTQPSSGFSGSSSTTSGLTAISFGDIGLPWSGAGGLGGGLGGGGTVAGDNGGGGGDGDGGGDGGGGTVVPEPTSLIVWTSSLTTALISAAWRRWKREPALRSPQCGNSPDEHGTR